MSISLMKMVWEAKMPESISKNSTSTTKIVLLKLADNANDSGSNCYPSIPRIAHETSLSERTVIRAIGMLESSKIIKVQTTRDNLGVKHNNYYINTPYLKSLSNPYMLDKREVNDNPFLSEPSDKLSEPSDKLSEPSDKLSPDPSVTINNHLKDSIVSDKSKTEKKSKKSKFKFSQDDMKLAEWIYSRVKAINPTAKKPNLDSWANDIRITTEQDNRTHKQLCDVFDWANRDQFWCSNIMSPSKLRKQFDNIMGKMLNENRKPTTNQSGRKLSPSEQYMETIKQRNATGRFTQRSADECGRVDLHDDAGNVPEPMEASGSTIELDTDDWAVIYK